MIKLSRDTQGSKREREALGWGAVRVRDGAGRLLWDPLVPAPYLCL